MLQLEMPAFYHTIQSFASPLLDKFFIFVSFLGSEPTYIILISLIFWNIDKRFGFRLAILFLSSMALNGILKDALHFQRPIGNPDIRSINVSSASGWSFPSGHSQGAATFYPYLWQHWPHRLIKVLGAIMIILIGFSRLYLGLHWPQDVAGGILLGLIFVFIFQRIDRFLFTLSFSLQVKLFLAVSFPLLFLPIYHTPQGLQLIGYIAGFAAGYFLEDVYLSYREQTKALLSLKKTVLGITVFAVWFFCWLPFTLQHAWLYLPVMAVGGIWVSLGAPILFRRLHWESENHFASDEPYHDI